MFYYRHQQKIQSGIDVSPTMQEPMTILPIPIQDEVFGLEDDKTMKETEAKRDDLRNPFWIQDNELLSGPRGYLKKEEVEFWKGMMI